MRVISGRLGGRIFDSPKRHNAHPMSEKMRGGLFSALGDISGLTLLDSFAGSGALSFEAISRGVAAAVAVESDKRTYKTIQSNAESLGVTAKFTAVNANAAAWSMKHAAARFDLVLCDPPYDWIDRILLGKLSRHVADNGIYVLSYPGSEEPPAFAGMTQLKRLSYGDSQLVFYQKDS